MEIRTRGQPENPLWYKVRKGRITASIFHDVLTRKSNTDFRCTDLLIICDIQIATYIFSFIRRFTERIW
jgi:hypothetical protein